MTKPSGMRPRIATLDFARGIAILGILLLNISAFGLPKAAYLNPAFNGQLSSSDAWTWAVLDLVAQGKFLMMFAILFGGGLYLLLPRGKHWIQARLSLLLLCGLLHAAFFWDGDILLSYGLIGLVCWRLVREGRSSQSLINTGIMLYLIGVAVLLSARVYQQSTARQLLVARPGAAAI
ncbi:putative membrane protein YeiB [Ewingella americana]